MLCINPHVSILFLSLFFCPVNEVAVYSLQAPEPRNRAEFLKCKSVFTETFD